MRCFEVEGVRFSIPKGVRQCPWDVFESKLRYMKGYAGESIQLAPGAFSFTPLLSHSLC